MKARQYQPTNIETLQAILARERLMQVSYQETIDIADSLHTFIAVLAAPNTHPAIRDRNQI